MRRPPPPSSGARAPPLPVRPGLVARPAGEDLRQGPVALFAAVAGGTGPGFAPGSQRQTNREVRPVGHARRARAPDRAWPLRVDTARSPQPQAVLAGGAAHRPTGTRPGLPAPGSWLTQGESGFSSVSRQGLRRASVRSTQDRRTLMPRFSHPWNPHFAQPFDWTDTGNPLAIAPPPNELLAA